jgi:hypothetical protein
MLRGHDEVDTLVLASLDGAKPAEALLGAVSAKRILQAAPGSGTGWSDLRLAAAADGSGWLLVKPAGTEKAGKKEFAPAPPDIALAGAGENRRAGVAGSAPEQPLRLTLARRPWEGTDLRLEDETGHTRAEFRLPLTEKPAFMQLPLPSE